MDTGSGGVQMGIGRWSTGIVVYNVVVGADNCCWC